MISIRLNCSSGLRCSIPLTKSSNRRVDFFAVIGLPPCRVLLLDPSRDTLLRFCRKNIRVRRLLFVFLLQDYCSKSGRKVKKYLQRGYLSRSPGQVLFFLSFENGSVFFYLLTPGLNLEAFTFAMVFQGLDDERPLLASLPFVAST